VREYPHNHRRLLDGCDDPELTSTLRAVFEVDIEDRLANLIQVANRLYDRWIMGLAKG